jgi:hypothetical protein
MGTVAVGREVGVRDGNGVRVGGVTRAGSEVEVEGSVSVGGFGAAVVVFGWRVKSAAMVSAANVAIIPGNDVGEWG